MMMAACDSRGVQLRIASSGRTTAPAGMRAGAVFYRREGRLPPPWDRGFLLAVLADYRTGAIGVDVTLDGEHGRRVNLEPGIAYLAVVTPTGDGFRTLRSHLLDVRPILGDQDAAAETINREWQSLGAGDTQVLFWDIVEPATRDQINQMANARGIRVRPVPLAGQYVVVPPQGDCSFVGSQPAPAADGSAPAPIAQPGMSATKTGLVVGAVLLVGLGLWAWSR